MRRYAKRLLIALVVSSSCFFATILWYHSGIKDRGNQGDKKPVALLQEHVNDVQRKPLARVIWESITKNENLYPGEAIRTSASAEAKILFLKTGTLIELEPNSLVVLEENENGIALDFLKGNLLVKGGKGDTGAQGLTLKTGNGQINLANADVSLSKTQKGDVDLEVFGGTAQLMKDGKTVTLDKDHAGVIGDSGLVESKDRIKVLSPLPGEPVFIDPKKDKNIVIQWEKLPPGFKVFIERGKEREQLTRYDTVSAAGETGELQIPQAVGKFYFRLVAVPDKADQQEMTSKVFSSAVVAKAPPVLLEPEKDGLVVINKESPNLKIKWATRVALESLAVEIAKDQQLQNKVAQEYLDSKTNFAELPLKEGGTYFWRITGFMKIKGKMEPVSSEIQRFTIQLGVDLIPPTLKSPMQGQRLTFEQVSTSGLYVSWQPVPGIQKYQVNIQQAAKKGSPPPEPVVRTVSASPFRLNDFTPGEYEWFIISLDNKDQPSKPSEKRKFMIDEMPRIDWVGGPEPVDYYYVTEKPSMSVSWTKGNDAIESWRYRFAATGFLSDDVKWVPANQPFLKTNVPNPGDYEVEVEGLNAKGKPVARTTTKIVGVKMKPLLAAPVFTSDVPTILQASKKGTLDVSWEPVPGATKYKFEMMDKDGKVMAERITERNVASFNKLKPGDYKVTVKAIDEHERPGKPGEVRELNVPNVSAVKAPKIKTIEVK